MPLDTTAILILLVSCIASFAIGRFIMQRRRTGAAQRKSALEAQRQAEILQAQLQAPLASNKAKRKRQQALRGSQRL